MKHRPALAVLAALTLLLCAIPCSAKTVYVKWNSPGPAFDGTSWARAYHTVQAGLNAAISGDQVWVARGTYVERITLKAGAALYGGFEGTETLLAQRNWSTNATILDGSQGDSVVTVPSGATGATRIDGFTIRNGLAFFGGGIYCPSSPTIANNTITGNGTTESPWGDGNEGGGIYCAGSPTITGNTIANNGGYGGGICCSGAAIIADNRITGNGTDGIYCLAGSSPTISGNIVSGNIGDGIAVWTATGSITNNTVTGQSGRGIYCSGTNTMAVSNNVVAFNASGIAVNAGATPALRNNCVYGNTSGGYSGISAGVGDISVDPLLADRAYGNLHIQPASPCRDTGWNGAPGIPSTDIDGQARVQPAGGTVDIGADESDGTTWTAGPYVIVRVSPTGNDGNSGSYWNSAKKTVQAAIDKASALGGEVWVKAGTYTERVVVRQHAYVYGGFAGTEVSRSQRNWTANKTTLDGGAAGTVVTIGGGCSQVSAIDGFTIRNGTGGGISCQYSSPMITNNIITANSASKGGGVSCQYSSPAITDNTIAVNSAGSGGGIYCTYSHPTITNNTIIGNLTTGAGDTSGGGGIHCDNSSPTITNNTVTGNTSTSYGGGISCYYSSPAITNNTLVGNTAYNHGGGIHCYSYCSPAVSNNLIAFNSSGIGSINSSAPTLRNNCVHGNTSYDYYGLSAGTGDISVDPLLADRAYGSVHIQPGSPCRDAGLDTAVGSGWLDMDGETRIEGAHVDIGADESYGDTWAAGPCAIVRVSPSGNDANDGSSWALAKKTVQAAIDAASILGGDVWVQAGTYGERIRLQSYAYVYGGFAGTEIARTERSWTASRTILDGGGAGSVVTVRVGTLLSAIDGFTIRNGRSANGGGGGIHCQYASTIIANNTIMANSGSPCGGIYCQYASPIIVNNYLIENSGAGIYGQSSSSTITNNTITAGIGQTIFGALYFSSSSPTVANNIVAFNTRGIYSAGGTPVLRNNCVYGNASYNYSGISAGEGDISADPLLASTAYGNLHIQPGSPCRNAGWNDAPQLPSSDIDGQARVQDGTADIGADESDGTAWSAAPSVIVRVSPSGSDANDGSTWALAKRTVQAAIDTASAVGGDVWVKAGIYNERIVLRPYAFLYGGFAGTETARSQRDWIANRAILDGGAGGSVVTITAGNQASTIDGFTIRNGTGTSSSKYGGGIYCSDASPIIANNTITGNSVPSEGAGIYCRFSSPMVVNNVITGNTNATYGSGIRFSVSTGLIANNIISGNTGALYAGGISCDSSAPRITNNTITANTATYGGAICVEYGSPAISNNIMAFNSSGIYIHYSGSPTLRNNDLFNTGSNYSGVSAGIGDISVDPAFVNRTGGDYHLTPASPCRNVGWNDVPNLPSIDMDGEARIYGLTVDMGADECWSTAAALSAAKSLADGTQTSLRGFTVSAVFDGFLYIEADNRTSGIRVDRADHRVAAGSKVTVSGTLATNADGERYIEALAVTPNGAGSIEPFLLPNRSVGGGDWLSGGAGQYGVTGGVDLNNMGLLVSTTGKVTCVGSGFFYLDDGSRLDDGSGQIGVKVTSEGQTMPALNSYVKVTGASSCYKRVSDLFRLIRATAIN